MVQSQKLPHSLLTELGRVVAIWANIEQDILMQTSALAAKATHGVPSEFLRLDFKRLRETWFRLCRDNFDTKTFNKSVNPINVEIARLAPFRHEAIHGTWTAIGRGKYHLSLWEQKTALQRREAPYSLPQIRGLVSESFRLAQRVRGFSHSGHGAVDSLNALVPEALAIIPRN
jgi:hypothetical protein